jgi:hypothetical protein
LDGQGQYDKPIKRKRQEPCEGRSVQGKEGKFSFCTLQVKADAGTSTPMPLDDLCSISRRWHTRDESQMSPRESMHERLGHSVYGMKRSEITNAFYDAIACPKEEDSDSGM